MVDTAIEETGAYFYSRMLLMIINGGLFFVAMLLVGMPPDLRPCRCRSSKVSSPSSSPRWAPTSALPCRSC